MLPVYNDSSWWRVADSITERADVHGLADPVVWNRAGTITATIRHERAVSAVLVDVAFKTTLVVRVAEEQYGFDCIKGDAGDVFERSACGGGALRVSLQNEACIRVDL